MWMNKIHVGFSKELFGFILKLHVYILRFNDQLSHVSTTKVVYNMKDRLNWIKTLRTVFIAISSSIKPLRADKATHLLLVVIYIKSYFRYRFIYGGKYIDEIQYQFSNLSSLIPGLFLLSRRYQNSWRAIDTTPKFLTKTMIN